MKGSWDHDRDPLSALRDGNPAPFEAFVRSELGTLVSFFTRQGAERAEAEDLTQEVFLRLFRSAAQYDARDRFSAYAWRVARNAWIDRRRRRGFRAEGGEDERGPFGSEVPDPHESTLDSLSRSEEAGRVHGALSKLSESHRLVFELGVLQELPYSTISELLEIPVGTVKSRMFHAVRRLREVLGEDDE